MSTAVEQSLQIALQEPAAAIAVAVLVGGGLVGMSIRTIVESVVIDDENDEHDDTANREVDTAVNERETATGAAGSESDAGSEPDPEELESRLDTLENEVGSLSSTVDSVRAENAEISESVDEVEANTGRLVSLFRRAMGGSKTTPEQTEETAQSEESGAVEHVSPQDGETGETQQERETEMLDGSLVGSSDDQGTPGVREKHCVDSDEEIIDAPGQPTTESSRDEGGITEAVEEIGAGTFEGTRFSSPDTTTETFGIEETITTVASDGGTAIESDTTSEFTPAAPESPSVAETETETPSVAETETPSVTEQETPSVSQPETTETEPQSVGQSDPTEIVDHIVEARSETAGGGKPYLDSLPDGFDAEVLTVEWMEFLVAEVGIREATRALEYYETIGWLTEDTKAELEAYLDGLEAGDRANLSVEHHLRTLEYVEELTVSERADGAEELK